MKIVKFVRNVAVVSLVVASLAANAAVDISSAVGGIADSGAALLSIIGALLAVSVLILGIGKVYGFIKKKAGG